MTGPVPILDGLGTLAEGYDAFLVDLWGAVHDGHAPYPGVVDCLRRLRGAGKKVLLLSNAPRRAARVARALDDIGVPRDSYDGVQTSGDETRDALAERADPWHAALGRAFFHLGPERDWGLLDGLDYRRVYELAEADFVLDTGFFDDETESVEDYDSFLAEALARRLPMVCANPDRQVMRGPRTVPCAGALAAAYEARGGDVRYHGKPHAGVYRASLARLGGLAPDRVLAVGDSLATDIAGAVAFGIDAVLVTAGIHVDEFHAASGAAPDARAVEAACERAGCRPVAAVAAVVW